MRTALDAPIRLPDGSVSTINAELAAGRAKVSRSDCWYRRTGIGTAFLAEGVGADWCLEISSFAFNSVNARFPAFKTED